MKVVNFKKVSIKNFLSVGRDPVTIDFSPGVHIITGINRDKEDRRNGVGKSTIADAIYFAIFGSTIRELRKEHIVNNTIGRGCEVVLEFSVAVNDKLKELKIVRMVEPSKCFLYVDGQDKTRDSIANTTEHICNVLSTTSDIFQNCVIMTINNTVPFMAKKKVDKRKFIEGIFNLQVFGDMLSLLRRQYNEVKRDFDIKSGKNEEIVKTLDGYKANKQDISVKQIQRKEELKIRKEENLKEAKELEEEITAVSYKDIESVDEKVNTLQECIDKFDIKISEINGNISTIQTEIKFKTQSLTKIGTDKDTCPVCLKTISQDDRQHIHTEKKTITKEVTDLEVNIEKHKNTLDQLDQAKAKLKKGLDSQNELKTQQRIKIKDNENSKQRIEKLHEWNIQIDKDLQNIKTEATQFDNLIKECEDRLTDSNDSISDVRHNISILDVVKFIVSEEGVKSYIVKKLLQVFNSKLAYYLRRMDANCCCIFNEYFEDEIVDEKGNVCSYHNFSGAERKNIDLACLFAFMDIRRLQGNVVYNLSIYDELLDSSLDETGVDLVLDILRERVEKYNECIMIISHRKESVKIGTHYKNPGDVIFLEKKKGFTHRIDFKE